MCDANLTYVPLGGFIVISVGIYATLYGSNVIGVTLTLCRLIPIDCFVKVDRNVALEKSNLNCISCLLSLTSSGLYPVLCNAYGPIGAKELALRCASSNNTCVLMSTL